MLTARVALKAEMSVMQVSYWCCDFQKHLFLRPVSLCLALRGEHSGSPVVGEVSCWDGFWT